MLDFCRRRPTAHGSHTRVDGRRSIANATTRADNPIHTLRAFSTRFAAVAIALCIAGPAQAVSFDLDLTVTGGTSDGVMGTPGSFSGSFDLPAFTGSGMETFNALAGDIQNFTLTLDNVWDAGDGINVTDTFTTAVAPVNFNISFTDGLLTGFAFTSLQFDPLDLFIDYPSGAHLGADWDLITDSDVQFALYGTLAVTAQGSNGNGNAVPEPSTAAMLGLGLAALGLFQSRRRARATAHKTIA